MTRRSLDRARFALTSTLVALSLLAPCSTMRAQSNLSTQGFGFPTGQFSSRAQGSAGSTGEMDPLSPINPATIVILGGRTLFFQMEPEYRTVTTAAGSEHTTTARYPVVFGALPVGNGWIVSLGSSTLLDRTSSTSFLTTQALGPGDSAAMITKFAIDGAMNDIRLAAAFAPASWLHVGAGLHAIAGHNLVTVTQSFVDSAQFSAFTEQRILSFSGTAASGGFEIVTKNVVASASGRIGGSLKLSAQDTTLTSAKVPNRFGAAIAYTGIAGSSFTVRTSRDNWSAMGNLGSPGLTPVDAWDTSVGADVAGPRFATRILYLRGGFRTRTLPFLAAGKEVSEKSFSGGVGSTFANGHVIGDLALIHASRSASLNASEHAWTISIGLSVRP